MLVKRKTIHFDNYRMYIFQNRNDVWQKPVEKETSTTNSNFDYLNRVSTTWFALPDASYIYPK